MKQLVAILLIAMALVYSGCLVESPCYAKQAGSRGITVKELRCEYAVNPLGIDVVQPRFTWILKSNERGQMQSAYQILVASAEEKLQGDTADKWDSGETKNLATSSKYASILTEHRKRLKDWERRLDVAPGVPNSDRWRQKG